MENISMSYCPQNVTFGEIWVAHGISKCFTDTIITSILTIYLLAFGSAQLWIYRKYGTQVNPHTIPKSKLYNLQKIFLYIIPLLSLARIILQATVLNDKKIYGYMVSE